MTGQRAPSLKIGTFSYHMFYLLIEQVHMILQEKVCAVYGMAGIQCYLLERCWSPL